MLSHQTEEQEQVKNQPERQMGVMYQGIVNCRTYGNPYAWNNEGIGM